MKRTSDRPSGFTLVELVVVIAILGTLAALLFPVFARSRENARGTTCLSNMRQFGMAVAQYLSDYDGVYPLNRFADTGQPTGGCGFREGARYNWRRAVWPYVKNRGIFACPSNGSQWSDSQYNGSRGDESNAFYLETEQLPNSYAYNGSFFHERTPCVYGEKDIRPRNQAEIGSEANLLLLLESRRTFPDLTSSFIGELIDHRDGFGMGAFQSHNGACTFVFADGHAKRMKLSATSLFTMSPERHWRGSRK